ncbi:N,N-dimethylformamidase beta subunit family domain-containing protein [Actinoplanes sp. NPDC026623]|uniref:N,N-dimethylformamidase beta subunit family domain-containing protein n=1 Tax=Actinoplanes sp. NPDC026623 TaxID=3155610 RepID=UPI0033C719B1
MRRRSLIGLLSVGAAGLVAYARSASASRIRAFPNRASRENRHEGTEAWRVAGNVSDTARQIQGYASATSVNAGESLDFHVTVAEPQPFTVTVYRLGHYRGAGARLMHTSEELAGRPQPVPVPDPATGLIDCGWPPAWTFQVPGDWTSGLFLAVFESRDGFRSSTPFVVRNDGRRSDLLVVIPFTTYAAYNMWPADGHTGKNLYRGYRPDGSVGGQPERAFQVSLNRPFAGPGSPSWFKLDVAAVQWAEATGYDVSYASSIDLHQGRVDPGRHRALVFPGHDEYWSGAMRDVVENAVRTKTHCAFLAANNIYWNVRVEADPRGVAGRVVTCYKDDPDPAPDAVGPTERWRSLGNDRERAEARLLGVQYNGILHEPVPLVVRKAGHWFWAGTGLRDGAEIHGLVAVEADGRYRALPTGYESKQVLLSRSPYLDRMGRGEKIQNTSLCQTPDGTIMFCAGTFHWPLALVESKFTDVRIQRATRNLFDRMVRR